MQRRNWDANMAGSVRTETVACREGLDGTIYVLDDGTGSQARIWPALGFNCLSWIAPLHGQTRELLWSDPEVYTTARPTRSGIPILFPFPNRIRAGRYAWEGKQYQLPINDAQQKNAIHGFVCQRPWRVTGHGTSDEGIWVAAEFLGSRDAPECQGLWPDDYHIEVRYLLKANRLTLDFAVRSPDEQVLPFGLGLHPYFRIPANQARVLILDPQLKRWPLADCLPTGRPMPLVGKHLRIANGRPLEDKQFDDIYHLHGLVAPIGLRASDPPFLIRMELGEYFRQVVVFTPPHREAVCVEPYTCVTDAINIDQQIPAAGWRIARPGDTWQATVRLVCEPSAI
jgi:aldose 1-epimerase